jgi:hypothetical protein
MASRTPKEEQIDLFANGTIYRQWRAGQPPGFSYVLDIGVGVGPTGNRSSRIVLRLQDEGFRSFEEAKHAIENAGIEGIVVEDEPEYDGEHPNPNKYEEIAGVALRYGPAETIRLQGSKCARLK